jgi:hypothetical protein
VLIVVVLFATVLLRFALIAGAAYLLLPRGPACPRCATEMALIRSPVLRLVVPALEHRWCMECGWNGVVRAARGGTGASVTPV